MVKKKKKNADNVKTIGVFWGGAEGGGVFWVHVYYVLYHSQNMY